REVPVEVIPVHPRLGADLLQGRRLVALTTYQRHHCLVDPRDLPRRLAHLLPSSREKPSPPRRYPVRVPLAGDAEAGTRVELGPLPGGHHGLSREEVAESQHERLIA